MGGDVVGALRSRTAASCPRTSVNAALFSVIRIAGGAYSSRSRTSSSKSLSGDTPADVGVRGLLLAHELPAWIRCPPRPRATLVVLDAEEADYEMSSMSPSLTGGPSALSCACTSAGYAPEDRVEEPAVPCPSNARALRGLRGQVAACEVSRSTETPTSAAADSARRAAVARPCASRT